MLIGVLIPQFPGQTHAFFWREADALRTLGVNVRFVSTRRPPPSIVSHTWAVAAMREAVYLSPPSPSNLGRTVLELLTGGPVRWLNLFRALARADVPSFGQRLRLGGMALLGVELAALARRQGWAHVHVHSCGDAANIAMLAFHWSGLPYSLTLHGDLSHYGTNQAQKWRSARFAVVVNQALLRDVRNAIGPALPAVVEVAPMGVELDRFRRSTPYESYSGSGPLRVFSCGRLNPGKGYDDLVDAMELLARKGVDARLTIAGGDDSTGAYRAGLERRIGEHKLTGRVELLGAVSEEQVREQLERAHVFVLASHDEALGVATMEAMAMEVPVVVTDVGGVGELVGRGAEGLLVEPHQPAQLAAAIAQLAADPGLAARLGRAGRMKVSRSYHSGVSATVMARHLMESGMATANPAAASTPVRAAEPSKT